MPAKARRIVINEEIKDIDEDREASMQESIRIIEEEEDISFILNQYLPVDPTDSEDDYYTMFSYIQECSKTIIKSKTEKGAYKRLYNFCYARIPSILRCVTGKTLFYVGKLSKKKVFEVGIKIKKNGQYDGHEGVIKLFYPNNKGLYEKHEIPPFWWARKYSNVIMSEMIVNIPYHLDDPCLDVRSFNVFRGFKAVFQPNMTIEEAKAICKPLLDHMLIYICNNNQELYDYMLQWYIFPIRNLRKTEIMLTMIGVEGIGKNIIFNFIRNWVTNNFMTLSITGFELITEKFNKALEDKLYVFISETANAGKKGLSIRQAEILKEVITGEEIMIEPKGVDSYPVMNYASLALATNNEHPIIISSKDRRNCVCETSDNVQSKEYYDNLVSKFDQNMGNAFYTLARKSEANYNLKKIPNTEIKQEIVKASVSQGNLFFDEVFIEGTYPLPSSKLTLLKDEENKGAIDCWIKIPELYKEYVSWHKDTNNGEFWSAIRFTTNLKKKFKVNCNRKRFGDGQQPNSFKVLPEHYDTISVIDSETSQESMPLSEFKKIWLGKNLTRN